VCAREDTYDSGLTDELGITEDESEAMVVHMKERKIVSLENKKHGIEEFPYFEDVVDVVESLKATVEHLDAANRAKDTIVE
jgi:hypothetical protein